MIINALKTGNSEATSAFRICEACAERERGEREERERGENMIINALKTGNSEATSAFRICV